MSDSPAKDALPPLDEALGHAATPASATMALFTSAIHSFFAKAESTIDSIPERKEWDANKKTWLQSVVAENWPQLPSYSTLKAPVIEEIQKATVGTGVVATFKEHGVQKVLLMKAGTHYAGPRYEADPAKPTYMIPGGFINLTETTGSSHVPADAKKAEHPRSGAAREIEEELVYPTREGSHDKEPVLPIDPDRLVPMDTKTLTFPSGERRVVIGFMLELTPPEVETLKAHVAKLESDPAYRKATRAQTVNPETGKPEICAPAILPLKEVAEGKHTLLYPDQASLFKLVAQRVMGSEIGR